MAINNPLIPGDPYSYDLKWLVEGINKVKNDIENFVAINAIKYADPIEWNITSQYGANTVVVDAQTGNAYISVKPVPAGVSIENTDFWTVVFNYQDSITKLQKQIAAADEGTSETATERREIGVLVWLSGNLYKVTRTIYPGERYIVDSNIKAVSIEEELENLSAGFIGNVEELKNSNLKPGDVVSTGGYFNSGDGGEAIYLISDETPSGYHELLNNGNYASIISPVLTPKMFGAYGNGETDDRPAIIAALAEAELQKKKLSFPNGKYIINGDLNIPYGMEIEGVNCQWPADAAHDTGTILIFNSGSLCPDSWTIISNMTIKGSGANVGIKLIGGRVYIHDISVMNCSEGITNSNLSVNLSRLERITITGCSTALAFNKGLSGTSSDSQSVTFSDIDIRECDYGYISNAPSNKFFNFCVQAGNAGSGDGYSVKLTSGATNNIFVGSYFENANYPKEVICENGTKNNVFNGTRVNGYTTAFQDDTGTNMFTAQARQIGLLTTKGPSLFNRLGIAYDGADSGYFMEAVADSSHIDLSIYGSSLNKELRINKQIRVNPSIAVNGRYMVHSLPYCAEVTSNEITVPANGMTSFTSAYFDKHALLAFANCNNDSNIVTNVAIQEGSNTLRITLFNTSASPITKAFKISVMIMFTPE